MFLISKEILIEYENFNSAEESRREFRYFQTFFELWYSSSLCYLFVSSLYMYSSILINILIYRWNIAMIVRQSCNCVHWFVFKNENRLTSTCHIYGNIQWIYRPWSNELDYFLKRKCIGLIKYQINSVQVMIKSRTRLFPFSFVTTKYQAKCELK